MSVSKMLTRPEPSRRKSTALILFIWCERSFRWLTCAADPPTIGSLNTISSSSSGSSMSRSSETPGILSRKGFNMASMISPSMSGSCTSCGSKCSGSPGSSASTDSTTSHDVEVPASDASLTKGVYLIWAFSGSTSFSSR